MRQFLSLLPVLALAPTLLGADPATVDYTRDIKPLLSDRCYACHGPDAARRKAKLRLDIREEAVKKAVKPGSSADSPLVKRIGSPHDDEVMPPPASKKPRLSAAQVELVRRWIDQGARFAQHWAYVKPLRPDVPNVAGEWPRNAIDHFVAVQQRQHGLTPAPQADRVTLVRRLHFDLIGLPPRPDDVDAFVNDQSPDAYEKLVERLLGSKHFGERMAVYWLDLVRYADTGGYHSDNHRDVTLFRDYVIDAFNANKRFDRFTIEQLAGDLLPQATTEQKIASGYNRLLQTTEEGGAQPKEYTAKYAADRVRNASSVWLASTMGCCECHDHKFDPFVTRDFYSLAAFFADIREKPVGRQDQTLLPSPQQEAELKKIDAALAELKTRMDRPNPELDKAQAAWEEEYHKAKTRAKLPKPVTDALAIEPDRRTPAQKQVVAAHYRTVAPLLEPLRKEQAAVQARRAELVKSIPTTLISMAGPPRTVRVLPRGNWQDDSGPVVQPDVPGFLSPHATSMRTRLDFANWLVHPDNPLTARVFVNRLWKLMFGQGIVKSLEDFGSQGAPPTHPQLLDWLATEFMASGWDVKHMVRLMITSATYRQSSVAAAESRERDPANLWLARQNRFRLDAEMVRDTALAIGGLLSGHVGGPSVKPAQPAGYWSFLNFPVREWQKDTGEPQYRRGLYTYWCRTFLHPAMMAFDAPSREECTVERPRSSTPLQALVLLNDPNFVEAARAFAEKTLRFGGSSDLERLTWAFRRALSRPPRPEEAKVLHELLARHRDEFTRDSAAAGKLLAVGDWPAPRDVPAPELAAWTSIARVLLNLHETITRN